MSVIATFAIADLPANMQSKIAVEDGCWIWTGYKNIDGYGQVSQRGVVHYAHRLAWTLSRGLIPDEMKVCHTCDNPGCCNPAHLFLGTQRENIADMWRKGRGSRHGNPRPVPQLRRSGCIRGHRFDSINTYVTPDGRRQCRACRSAAASRRRIAAQQA